MGGSPWSRGIYTLENWGIGEQSCAAFGRLRRRLCSYRLCQRYMTEGSEKGDARGPEQKRRGRKRARATSEQGQPGERRRRKTASPAYHQSSARLLLLRRARYSCLPFFPRRTSSKPDDLSSLDLHAVLSHVRPISQAMRDRRLNLPRRRTCRARVGRGESPVAIR